MQPPAATMQQRLDTCRPFLRYHFMHACVDAVMHTHTCIINSLTSRMRAFTHVLCVHMQGDYGLRVVARDASGGELVCIDVDFQLVAPSLDATTAQPASNTKLLPGRQQQQEQGQAGAGTGGAATKEGGLPAQQGAANRRAAAF